MTDTFLFRLLLTQAWQIAVLTVIVAVAAKFLNSKYREFAQQAVGLVHEVEEVTGHMDDSAALAVSESSPHDNRVEETIGCGDIIEVKLAASSDPSSEVAFPVRVAKDGAGRIPQIGRIELADLSVSAAETRFAAASEKLGL